MFPPRQTLCVTCKAETHFFFFISGAVSHLYPTRSTIPIAEISCSVPSRDRGDEYITVVQTTLRTLEGSGKRQTVFTYHMLDFD